MKPGALGVACVAFFGLTAPEIAFGAGQITPVSYQTDVDLLVLPFAEIEVTSEPLLYLRVPPPGSTIPSRGVTFRVSGNANATVVAEPDNFVLVPNTDYPSGEYMGKAVLGGGSVGYRLEVHFPVAGVATSPAGYAGLPGFEPGPTLPRTVNLLLTGGSRVGRLHMTASEEWTPDGGLPLPGIYFGTVTLTVTAD